MSHFNISHVCTRYVWNFKLGVNQTANNLPGMNNSASFPYRKQTCYEDIINNPCLLFCGLFIMSHGMANLVTH